MPPSEIVRRGIDDQYIRAWVVFQRSTRRYPWDWFCGGIGHCWIMWSRYWPAPSVLAAEFTLKAEYTPGGLYCDMALVPPATMLGEVLASRPESVLYLSRRVTRARMRYFGALTCVTVVKAVLNLDAPWCLTPRQLHRRLFAEGAKPVRESD